MTKSDSFNRMSRGIAGIQVDYCFHRANTCVWTFDCNTTLREINSFKGKKKYGKTDQQCEQRNTNQCSASILVDQLFDSLLNSIRFENGIKFDAIAKLTSIDSLISKKVTFFSLYLIYTNPAREPLTRQ